MIGMNFASFLTLLIISLVVAFVIHYLFRYRFAEGFDAFIAKSVLGWFGGWLGTPVLGYWPEALKVDKVYIIPAVLGAAVAIFLGCFWFKAWAKVWGAKVP